MQKKPKEMNNTLELEKEKLITPIREKLLATIKEVAKAMGYDHVLYKESALVFPAAADLTNAVKNKLGIK
jgi:Skp family chaperone for outer membrane proteins